MSNTALISKLRGIQCSSKAYTTTASSSSSNRSNSSSSGISSKHNASIHDKTLFLIGSSGGINTNNNNTKSNLVLSLLSRRHTQQQQPQPQPNHPQLRLQSVPSSTSHSSRSTTVSSHMSTRTLPSDISITSSAAAATTTSPTTTTSTANNRKKYKFSWMDVSFLDDLRYMLNEVELTTSKVVGTATSTSPAASLGLGVGAVVAWEVDGKSFKVLDPIRFAIDVLPRYLNMVSYSTFKSVLQSWGFFKRMGRYDVFYHPKFSRDGPSFESLKSSTLLSGLVPPAPSQLLPLPHESILDSSRPSSQGGGGGGSCGFLDASGSSRSSTGSSDGGGGGSAKISRFVARGGLLQSRSFSDPSLSTPLHVESHIKTIKVPSRTSSYTSLHSVGKSVGKSGIGRNRRTQKFVAPQGQGKLGTFLQNLHEILNKAEVYSVDHIISWVPPHGNAFKIHDKDKFVQYLLPMIMSNDTVSSSSSSSRGDAAAVVVTSFKSFRRMIDGCGFKRNISGVGPDLGSFYHPYFIKDRPTLFLTKSMVEMKSAAAAAASAVTAVASAASATKTPLAASLSRPGGIAAGSAVAITTTDTGSVQAVSTTSTSTYISNVRSGDPHNPHREQVGGGSATATITDDDDERPSTTTCGGDSR